MIASVSISTRSFRGSEERRSFAVDSSIEGGNLCSCVIAFFLGRKEDLCCFLFQEEDCVIGLSLEQINHGLKY